MLGDATKTSPRDLCVGLLVALGILTALRELASYLERLRLAAELEADPEGPARAAEDILREEEPE